MFLDGKAKSLDRVLFSIENADDFEISEIIKAVIRRYEIVYPDWEVMFLSLPKHDPAERRRCKETVLEILQKSE